MCARSSSSLSTLLNNSYPAQFATLTANNTFGLSTVGSRDALEAVLAGRCAGAVLPTTEVAWVLGVNDTMGDYCGLVPVDSPIGEESMPLTFSAGGPGALTAAQLEVINSAITDMQRQGTFLLSTLMDLFPGGPRPVCQVEDAKDAAALVQLAPASRLQPIDMAGAFVLQAIGIGLGAILHVSKRARKRAGAYFMRVVLRHADGKEGKQEGSAAGGKPFGEDGASRDEKLVA